MQDVGCRIYTFAYTMANSMIAARRFGKKLIVCDRPNPINGVAVGGNVLEPQQASFVGQYPIPTRHGMTLGELARMFNEHFGINCELEVIKMGNWARELWYDETDGPWCCIDEHPPTSATSSGKVPSKTQRSEGRGIAAFELVGAPT